jgi:CRP-like cAMP-binding protein
MKSVGTLCRTLDATDGLAKALIDAGETKRYQPKTMLFCEGTKNYGVFLIRSGKVCLQLPGAPKFDRLFSAGAVLGLPSTFSERPYSLTATCLTECKVTRVGPKVFLKLMKSRPELCRVATDILGKETTFLLKAIREQPATAYAAS